MAQTLPVPAKSRDMRLQDSDIAEGLAREIVAGERSAASVLAPPDGPAPASAAARLRASVRIAKAGPRVVLALPHHPAAPTDAEVVTEPAEPKNDLDDAPLDNGQTASGRETHQRSILLRDVRRAWMGSPFKRMPHALLACSVRLAKGSGADTPEAQALLERTTRALVQALEDLAPSYQLGDTSVAMLLPDKTLRHAERVAEAIKKAIEVRAAEAPLSPVIFAAGVAAIHRDDDPVSALCLTERCLSLAEESEGSAVVGETDARIRIGGGTCRS